MKYTDAQLDGLILIVQTNSNIDKRWQALEHHPLKKELGITKAGFLTKKGARNQSMEGRVREYLNYDLSRPDSFSYRGLRDSLNPENDSNLYAQTAKKTKSGNSRGVFFENVIAIAILGLMLGFVFFMFVFQSTGGSSGITYLLICSYLFLGFIYVTDVTRDDAQTPGKDQWIFPLMVVLWLPKLIIGHPHI